MDPYQTLGVPLNATEKQIIDAYRKLVKLYHPDRNNSDEAKVMIRNVNEAYSILTDPVKRSRYNYRSGPSIVYPTPTKEEQAYNAYKAAYIRKKREEAQRAKARELEVKMSTFKIMRMVSFPILAFAFVLVIDEWIPPTVFVETVENGWQERVGGSRGSNSSLASFMQTENFVMIVPDEVHLEYDYFGNPEKIRIEASPIFNVPGHIEVPVKDRVFKFEAGDTLYSFFFPLHYLLFLSTLFVVSRKTFTTINYSVCFLPTMFLIIVILKMF
jgi:hypothetical protein